MTYKLFTIASLVLAAGTAMADSPTPVVMAPVTIAPVTVSSATDWSGVYIGIGASYSEGSYDAGNGLALPDATGALASFIVGRNFQRDNLVYGAEAVLNFGNVGESTGTSCGAGTTGCTSEIEQYAAIRGRVGYAFEKTLVFATLGIATDKQAHRLNGTQTSPSDNQRHYGYTVGIGVEQDLVNSWSLRGDLEYYDFGSETYDLLGGTSIDADTTAIRLSLVKRF